MIPIQAGAAFYVGVFAVLGVLLVAVGVVAMAWLRLWGAVFAGAVRAAYRLGLYRPDERTSHSTDGPERDRGIILFTRALRAMSRPLSGTPTTNARTVVLPLLLLGIPVFLAVLVVLWVVPVTLFGVVWTTVPTPWSSVLAMMSLVAYFGLFLAMWHVGRVPALLDRASRRF